EAAVFGPFDREQQAEITYHGNDQARIRQGQCHRRAGDRRRKQQCHRQQDVGITQDIVGRQRNLCAATGNGAFSVHMCYSSRVWTRLAQWQALRGIIGMLAEKSSVKTKLQRPHINWTRLAATGLLYVLIAVWTAANAQCSDTAPHAWPAAVGAPVATNAAKAPDVRILSNSGFVIG